MDFQELLDNYPQDMHPCFDISKRTPFFENQCAIRMGICLQRSGLDFEKYKGVRCWHHPESDNHVLRVEELVKFLKKKLPNDLLTEVDSKDGYIDAEDFEGLTGIIVFINFWGDGNQGDHIDLWNEDCLLTGDVDYFERSEKVLFWEIV